MSEMKALQAIAAIMSIDGHPGTLEGIRKIVNAALSAKAEGVEATGEQGFALHSAKEQSAPNPRGGEGDALELARIVKIIRHGLPWTELSPDDLDMLANTADAYLTLSSSGRGREAVWVIERFENGRSAGYWNGLSSRSFVTEIDKAVWFVRRTDTLSTIHSWHWRDVQPTEHVVGLALSPQGTGKED